LLCIDAKTTGTKKLLEIYYELLNSHSLKTSESVAQTMKEWGGVKSLAPILKKINSVAV